MLEKLAVGRGAGVIGSASRWPQAVKPPANRTTVKAVVIETEAAIDRILWHDYQRHDTRQPEKLLEFLRRMEAEIGVAPGNCRMFITGSGGNALSALSGLP